MMMEMVSKPEVQDVAQDAEQRLRRACKSLQSEGTRRNPKKPEENQLYRANNELIGNKSAGLSVPLACRNRKPPSNTL